MINRIFVTFATWFSPFKKWFVLVAIAMTILIVKQLVDNTATVDSTQFLPYYLLGLLWMLFFYTIASAFEPSSEVKLGTGFFARLKQRMFSAFSFLMTVVFIALFLASCYVSIRFINLLGN